MQNLEVYLEDGVDCPSKDSIADLAIASLATCHEYGSPGPDIKEGGGWSNGDGASCPIH